ncbi:uncharacterized protein LOC121053428 [Oryza brachyantha]|uniref:uncharacterized protein LOC121053428 n=1 Tax=Oryza brachyantha TaxID=4533 RepID=UPI001ADD0880|nr:uncharacterized protein LOC121053428 [Oryza brachyantha]
MAPNGEASSAVAAVAPFLAKLIGGSDVLGHVDGDKHDHKEMEQLTTTTSGNGGGGGEVPAAPGQEQQLQVVVVEEAECECCGMSEECTPAYIGAVRQRFSGRWVCGLCAAAVTEEAGKNGGEREAALAAHMAVCKRFNGFGRTHPALFHADAMRDILRKLAAAGGRNASRRDLTMTEGAMKATGGVAGGMVIS